MKISDEEFDEFLKNLKKQKHQEKLSDEFKANLVKKMEDYANELDRKKAKKETRK